MTVFDSLVGQRDLVDVLRAAAAGEGMTHAWLFTGPPGSGRSVAARAFAAALLCNDGGCGTCASCHQVRAGSHADVVVLNPAGLSISVDEARDVVRRSALARAGSRWHVVLIEDADRLTERAANVWLKAIEEPEAGSVFLLCAPSLEDLPPTIRSRCRHVALRLASADDVAGVLVREGVDESMAFWAARASQGHIGHARALARDEDVRRQRQEALSVPHRLASVGEALGVAAELIELTREEADRGTKAKSAVETEEFGEALGGARGAKSAMADLARRQKSRETRARRDQLDRALVDLVAWYRDVLSVQLAASIDLVHADQTSAIERAAAVTGPDATMRRIEAVLACREAVAANVDPLLAVEQMTLTLRAP